MGARPMARLIQDTIRRGLADELLFGRLQHGGKVTIDIGEDERSSSPSKRKRRRSPDAVGRIKGRCQRLFHSAGYPEIARFRPPGAWR
jgi:hypothetical protein